jgi:hypothetical protein
MSHKFSLGQAVVFSPALAKFSTSPRGVKLRALGLGRAPNTNMTSKSNPTASSGGLWNTSSGP